MSKQYLPYTEENPDFQNSKRLLQQYRKAAYRLKTRTINLKRYFEEEYGVPITEFLEQIKLAGLDLNDDTNLLTSAQEIKWYSDILSLVDTILQCILDSHEKGNQYYHVLYYTYICPKKLSGDDIYKVIGEAVKGSPVCKTTYHKWLSDAIAVFDYSLWYNANHENIKAFINHSENAFYMISGKLQHLT